MNGFRHRAVRVLGHIAVVIGILAVIAAAFALSYDAVRDIARAAGVPATLARIYPGILDAVFLVACAAALMLRDARWWTRLYTWLSVLVTGGLIGAADAYHSMGLRLPQRTTAGTIAALPWALVMLAFSLWLTMLRHSRSGAAVPPTGTEPAVPGEIAGPAPLAGTEPSVPEGTASPALALAASPAARPALPAPEPEPVNQPSIIDIEGRSAETPPSPEVTTAAGPMNARSAENPPSTEAAAAADPMESRSAENPPPADVTTAAGPTEGRSAENRLPAEATAAAGPMEGHSVENPPPAAAEAPEEHAPETGAVRGAASPADRADASPDDGDAADDEALGDRPGQPSSSAGPHPSDADTPPYGFPVVTGQDVAAHNGSHPTATTTDRDEDVPAVRTPTLLSAPVPADVAAPPEPAAVAEPETAEPAAEAESATELEPETSAEPAAEAEPETAEPETAEPAAEAEPVAARAEPGSSAEPAAEAEPEPAGAEPATEPEDVAAKGRPPAASSELSGAEAELAHEGRPTEEQPVAAKKKPPTPFERVRSTPTRPAPEHDAPQKDGAA